MTEVFAHRGLHRTEIENTVAAFLEAKAVGADGVELDVRRTVDGALVVHHDAVISEDRAIATMRCRDLPRHIATLEEALNVLGGLRVNVEIKNSPTENGFDPSGALAHQVVAALEEWGWTEGVIISSFDLPTCEAARRADADIAIGWLLDWRTEPTGSIDLAAASALNAVHPFFARVDGPFVAEAHQRGLEVNVWTVNEAVDMARMFAVGVDTLITDDPALALATRDGSP
jgi:glycerophosphoryl diester phosphodiesterase